jgi:spore maturation protein CgeB
MTKLLILDGISGVPLGKELCEAFVQIGMRSDYADLRKFESQAFYGVKAGFRKAMNKRENADSFYHMPKLNEAKFASYLQQLAPTAILVIGFVYKYLNPQFLQKICKENNIQLFLYDTDSCNLYAKRREFIFFLDTELPMYDEIFSFSQVTTRFFKDTKKLNATFLPFGANDIACKPIDTQSTDVLFIGSCDLRRIFLLERIKDKVAIFGDRWNRNYPLISDTLKSKINDQSIWGDALYKQLADAKIVLNITRSHFYGVETGVNLRIFEALAAGCFLLTDYCEELEELFVIGEEIEVFRDASDLAEKVDFYLNNPELRNKIAQHGHEKFLKKHLWMQRAKECASRMLNPVDT